MNQLRHLLIAIVTILGVAIVPAATAKPVLNQEYKLVDPPQPQPATVVGVEVLEFFNYACSHCYEFEPNLKAWLKIKPKKAVFRYVPAVFNERMIPFAKIYYTLEEMDLIAAMHDKVYAAIHQKQLNLAERTTLLKKTHPQIHVVMLSGQQHYGVAAKTIARGAEQYVMKDDDAFKNLDLILEDFSKVS